MYRGKYKSKDEYGKPIFYQRGDVVIEQGKIFSCTESTIFSPLQQSKQWVATGVVNPYTGTNPPINPIENQLWVSDSGIQYIYYKDTDGYQWVET